MRHQNWDDPGWKCDIKFVCSNLLGSPGLYGVKFSEGAWKMNFAIIEIYLKSLSGKKKNLNLEQPDKAGSISGKIAGLNSQVGKLMIH